VRGIRSSFALRTVAAGVLLAVAFAVLASVVVVATHRQQQLDEVDQTGATRAAMLQQLISRVSVA
jgi:high-affinity Fe2+/Pb2+ permease